MEQQGKSEKREVQRCSAAGDELGWPEPSLWVEYLKTREATHSPVPGQAPRPTAPTQVSHLLALTVFLGFCLMRNCF